MRARAILFVGLVAAATRLSVTGRDDSGSHIYPGEQYNPTLECLEPLESVDIVSGPEPMTPCGPICILSLPEDGGQIAYISTMCAPYPLYPYETDASTDPLCVAALEAFKRDALCEDGGVVLPPNDDSGPDAAEAGAEASSDAASEADAPSDAVAD